MSPPRLAVRLADERVGAPLQGLSKGPAHGGGSGTGARFGFHSNDELAHTTRLVWLKLESVAAGPWVQKIRARGGPSTDGIVRPLPPRCRRGPRLVPHAVLVQPSRGVAQAQHHFALMGASHTSHRLPRSAELWSFEQAENFIVNCGPLVPWSPADRLHAPFTVVGARGKSLVPLGREERSVSDQSPFVGLRGHRPTRPTAFGQPLILPDIPASGGPVAFLDRQLEPELT
ncbi:hypothetical protein ACCO45_013114 [Purpureocillium lilacinum]|uniref:Uncharacterized protein n=1 Tax=Purpureocillium lilacinum TaxID=33203 RepID=A0ACC4DCH5_PURLI